jgi:SAM-dependent methyltransferase
MSVPGDEFGILRLKGRDWLKYPARKKRWWVRRAFVYWRSRGFPYPKLAADEIHQEFTRLANSCPSEVLIGRLAKASTIGLRLANLFHPHMWSAKVSGCRSPVECFNNDRTLEDCIIKALNFWPNRSSLNDQCLRSVLRIYNHTARVANFRPAVARAIYTRYSHDGGTVLDFSAGYGGRLLGCLTLDRTYIGIEPCASQVIGLKKMIGALNGIAKASAHIYKACAEDFMPSLRSGSIDMVFSSPPYFDHERYSSEPTQSYIRYGTYEEWRSAFLERVIKESCRVLKRGGHLLMNVSKPRRGHPIARHTLECGLKHFEMCGRIHLLMRRVPQKNGRSLAPFKTEPILVFRKR